MLLERSKASNTFPINFVSRDSVIDGLFSAWEDLLDSGSERLKCGPVWLGTS